MSNPIYLTQEEIDELVQSSKTSTTSNTNSANLRNPYNIDLWGRFGNNESSISRRRHHWVPVLLLNQTVYDCKHCKAKKEKTKEIYCEEEF